MATLTHRATIYLNPFIHKVLRIKAAETDRSISELVDEALRHELSEDEEDLKAFSKTANEPSISYERLLKKLKADGKI